MQYKRTRQPIRRASSGCANAGDTKFIPNLKTERYFIRNDSNDFLNMDIFYVAAAVDSFIFVVNVMAGKKRLIYTKIMQCLSAREFVKD